MSRTGSGVLAGALLALVLSLGWGCSGGDAPPIGNPSAGYCPVMGNKVDAAKAGANPKLYADYQGKRYLFCCSDCKPEFEKEPAKFITNPAKPKE